MSDIGKPLKREVYEPAQLPLPIAEPAVAPEKKVEEPEPQEVPA